MSNSPDIPENSDSYLTLRGKSDGIFKEQGSRFLYFSFPVKSEEDIKIELVSLRKLYFDASHHCYAWSLGRDAAHFRANDDGEPNHSAGDPILGQIRSNQLTDVLIVVVRYFGGTKLGVSGLIKAYRTAAALAIEENEITKEWVKAQLNFSFPYAAMNEVMKIVKALDIEILSQEMALDCSMTLSMRESNFAQVLSKLEDIEGLVLATG
ncbi:YigZ family protein [Algoriphagus jejuensis]|uniref:YigZ family protein n=1 Tax=Algoriphagus jejuensis TaxID=419934 RepID=A0ABN1N1J9_9BACT